MVNGLIVGFLIGMLVGGWWASYFMKILKKNGYMKVEATDKLLDELYKVISKNKLYDCNRDNY